MRQSGQKSLVLSDSDLWSLLSLLQVIQQIRSTDFGHGPEAVQKLTNQLGTAILQSDLYCFGTQITPAIREIEDLLKKRGWDL